MPSRNTNKVSNSLDQGLCSVGSDMQSLRKFPRLYRTAGLVDWKNLPDQPQFHQTDTILEQTTKKEKT